MDSKKIIEYIANENISHVSFDYWNTLVTSNHVFKQKRTELIGAEFVKNSEQIIIENAFKYIGEKYNKEMLIGNSIIPPLELLKRALKHIKFDDLDHINKLYNECLLLFESNPPIIKIHHLNLLLELLKKKGISLSITSNTAFIPGQSIRLHLSKIGCLKYFDFMLFSDEVNCAKPSKVIFDKIYLKLIEINKNKYIEKSTILHIGDDIITDYNGALSYGFKALLI